jgi:hypothetical protein
MIMSFSGPPKGFPEKPTLRSSTQTCPVTIKRREFSAVTGRTVPLDAQRCERATENKAVVEPRAMI